MSAWVDVFGSPGCGKSSICDPFCSDGTDRDIEASWDGTFPKEWEPFLDQLDPLFMLIKNHQRAVPTRNGSIPSIRAMVGMLTRNLRRMAALTKMDLPSPYFGTGFAMRGIGIGWRAVDMGYDPKIVKSYFWTMPVSLGCAYLKCSSETLKQRNRERRNIAETAHEDRSFQIDLQLPVIEVMRDVLAARGVPVLELDTEFQPPDQSRKQLLEFAQQIQRDQRYSDSRYTT